MRLPRWPRRGRLCVGPLCVGPLLLLLGVALGLFHQTRLLQALWPSDRDQEGPRAVSALERLSVQDQRTVDGPAPRPTALVLTGQHVLADTELQLYLRVLQEMGFEVRLSRYAETTSLLQPKQGMSSWSLLMCLSSSETSCLRRVSFSQLQDHQQVNLLPQLQKAFSDVGHGLCHIFTFPAVTGTNLQMRPFSCGAGQKQRGASIGLGKVPDAELHVFVLVSSMKPVVSFVHDTLIVKLQQENSGRTYSMKSLRADDLCSSASGRTLTEHIKKIVEKVLQTVASTYNQHHIHRCLLCYQLLTFTLLFNAPLSFSIVQVDTDWTFSALDEDNLEQDVTRDQLLEDVLRFFFRSTAPATSRGACREDEGCAVGLSLSEDDLQLLLHVRRQMKNPGPFHPVSFSSSLCSSSTDPGSVSDLLIQTFCFYERQQNISLIAAETESTGFTGQTQNLLNKDFVCTEPLLRQIYSDPALALTPLFEPRLKEYHVEVPFDTVMVHLRPEPLSPHCRVHLEELRGPSVAHIPLGLGRSTVRVLVTDRDQSESVRTVYTLHVFRDERPGLPMFGDHLLCSFTQECGLLVRPDQSCGLQPFNKSLSPAVPCSSGDAPGRWVVPCLSCTDNRTCQWRDVEWRPDDCYHPLTDPPQLHDCLADTKLLFIGDSTNRGMMYFLMERLNHSLLDWDKVHDTVIYSDINQGRTSVSFSYYPQFWLQPNQKPTFTESLDKLLDRSQPLLNSRQTALVVGGVQWLRSSHLRLIRDALDRRNLNNITVVVKSLGMGFHLFVDGARSLTLSDIQELFRENRNIISAAKANGFEVIDTFSITMGRYKEFLQGRCACHFHQVEKHEFFRSSTTKGSRAVGPGAAVDQGPRSKVVSYKVKGPVNQVYSEILLSRLCPN